MAGDRSNLTLYGQSPLIIFSSSPPAPPARSRLCFVRAGLRRTGKSCRLRWVNYLHPGLKRGRITADEERLILTLHAEWGSRWSRIARKLPGRTDNEIKNYWRTHTRKLHKDTRAVAAADGSGSAASASTTTTSTSMSPASPATTSSSSSSTTDNDNHSHHHGHGHHDQETAASCQEQQQAAEQQLFYTSVGAMDSHLLWNDDAMLDSYAWGATALPSMIVPPPSSPVWDYCCSDSLWGIGDDEVEYKKMLAVAGAS